MDTMKQFMNSMSVNPFTREYHQNIIDKMGYHPLKDGNIEIEVVEDFKRDTLDGFMYRDIFVQLKNVPLYKIGGKIWMGLTPMEIESHYLPILHAVGRVGVGGLGLGYYVQNILAKPDVSEVIVYETNQEVIDFYLKHFGKHEKLTIHNQDVLEIEGETFDYFYNDTYHEMYNDAALDHMKTLCDHNNIKHYHFWTMECYLLSILSEGKFEGFYRDTVDKYYPYLIQFLNTRGSHTYHPLNGEEVDELFHEYDIYSIL